MKPSLDYPRMLFHRTKAPVTVQSREEEDALGNEWARTIWPKAPAMTTPEGKEEQGVRKPEQPAKTAAARVPAAGAPVPEPEPEPAAEEPEREPEPAPKPKRSPPQAKSKLPAMRTRRK